MKGGKNTERPYVNDERIKEILIDGLNAGHNWAFTKTTFYDYLKTIIKVDKKRCLRLHDTFYPTLQFERNKAKIELGLSIDDVKEIEKEVGTKKDRLVNLKKLVDEALLELDNNEVTETKLVDGKPTAFKRPMTQSEKNFTRRTIKDIQAEISKIQGDYAEIKISGEINNNVTFADIENMSEEEQLILLQADKLLNKR